MQGMCSGIAACNLIGLPFLQGAGVEKVLIAAKCIAGMRLAVILCNSLVYYFLMGRFGTIPWLTYLIILLSLSYGLIAAIGAVFASMTLQQTRTKLKLRILTEQLDHEVEERRRIAAELAAAHRRMTESLELERLHLARELHDGPVQDLYGVRFQLKELSSIDKQASRSSLDDAQVTLQHVSQTLRTICSDLRPPALTPLGLEVAHRGGQDYVPGTPLHFVVHPGPAGGHRRLHGGAPANGTAHSVWQQPDPKALLLADLERSTPALDCGSIHL